MTEQTIQGMLCLYSRLDRFKENSYYTEIAERALNEFVRNPSRNTSFEFLVNSACGSAKKVLKNREKYQQPIVDEDKYEYYFNSEDTSSQTYDDIENLNYIEKMIKNAKYAEILCMLYNGHDAKSISVVKGITQKHANILISRARKYAKNNLIHAIDG